VLNFSVNGILRLQISDYTSGFIVCRRELLVGHSLTGDYGEYFIELMYYLTRSRRRAEGSVLRVAPAQSWRVQDRRKLGALMLVE